MSTKWDRVGRTTYGRKARRVGRDVSGGFALASIIVDGIGGAFSWVVGLLARLIGGIGNLTVEQTANVKAYIILGLQVVVIGWIVVGFVGACMR